MTVRGSWFSPVLDAFIAALAMVAAYRLRFAPPQLGQFFEAARYEALLFAVLVPLVGLAIGAYRFPNRLWPIRLMLSVAVAIVLAAALTWLWNGFDGVSRFAFMPAAVLTVLGAGAWRAAEGLRVHRAAVRQPGTQPTFEDRAASAPPLGLGLLRLLRYRELLRNLVVKDLKLKYRGSTLGFIWSLANPLAMLVVYSIAFTYILGIRRQAFVLFLFVGLLPWTFFSSTISMATVTIAEAGGLLKSVRFPRTVMPAATVLFNLSQYLMTFGVLLPVMLVVFRVAPAPPMLLFPVVLLLLVLFTSGAAFMVATANVYYRDVKHLVDVALQVMFWVTPIVYDLNDVPERLRLPILLTPMSPFVSALHDIFYRQAWPDVTIWMAAISWSVAMFVGGLTVFLTYEDRFAEQL
jgi:ABC-2 type transport system permease protein